MNDQLSHTTTPLTDKKIALVIGGENHGISSDMLQEIDIAVRITMYGKNSSMIVVQAAGIALHCIIQSLNK